MKLPIIIAAALSSAAAPATPPKYPASAVFIKQRDVIEKMNSLYPSVDVDVRWEPCEVENSYYWPGRKRIVLCTEFEAYPGAAVFVAAHEMAHAIQHQLTDVTSEQDADELGALGMVKFGYATELLEAAVWWKSQPDQGRTGEEHPANGFRAWELACIAAGADGGPKECADLYQGLRVRWNSRLSPAYTTFFDE